MIEKNVFNYQQEIERLQELFGFDFIALALVQSAEGHFALKWEYVTGNESTRYRRIVMKTGKGVGGVVFKTGKPLHVQDVDMMLGKDELFNYPIVVAEGLKSFGAIPLYKYNRVKGVLLTAYRTENKMTYEKFSKLKDEIGSNFGPFYHKEMVKH